MTAAANILSFNCPDKMTKRLAFQKKADNKRRLTISTNWLPLVGFEAEAPNVERSLGKGKGIVIERVRDLLSLGAEKVKKVYTRSYKSRKNNPIETQLQVSSQKLLDEAFPAECTHVHITFTMDRVVIRPLTSHQQRAIEHAKKAEDPYSVFAACTSGVDLYSMEKQGCSIQSVIEYRPFESRDKKDLTETGALNAVANSKIQNVYNEDIMSIDVRQLAADVSESPFTTFVISPQCDDFSNVKAKSLKDRSLEDLSSTIDMGYDLLRIVEALAPPTILIENVSGWVNSDMYRTISLRLRRWGYQEHCIVADARDFGGLTSRKRAYSFFTALPAAFSWEEATDRRTKPIWNIIEEYLPECRDVTHSKSLQDGIKCGRLRTITPESCHSPTILKSQLRMAKDSMCIAVDDRLYWPTEALMKRLMGIGEDFNLDNCSSTIASEIIGQSVDLGLHDSVVRSVMRHLKAFFQDLNPLQQFWSAA